MDIFRLFCERDNAFKDTEYDRCCALTEIILKEMIIEKNLEKERNRKHEDLVLLETNIDYAKLLDDNNNFIDIDPVKDPKDMLIVTIKNDLGETLSILLTKIVT